MRIKRIKRIEMKKKNLFYIELLPRRRSCRLLIDVFSLNEEVTFIKRSGNIITFNWIKTWGLSSYNINLNRFLNVEKMNRFRIGNVYNDPSQFLIWNGIKHAIDSSLIFRFKLKTMKKIDLQRLGKKLGDMPE